MRVLIAVAVGGAVLLGPVTPAGAQNFAMPRAAYVVRLDAVPDLERVPDVLRKRVTLRVQNVTVARALDELIARAQISLTYSRAFVPADRIVSVDVDQGSVLQALGQLLGDSGIEAWVSSSGRIALVPTDSPARSAATAAPRAEAAVGGLTGRVVDSATSRPLANVQVAVVGTRLGGVTNDAGRYTILGVPAGPQTVRAILIGFAPRSQTVTVADGQPTTADFTMTAQAVQLQAVVAVGYGTQRRENVTGAIVSVSGEDLTLKAAPTVAISNALQGKAAGVQVVTASGVPGAGASVRVRGTNSIGANTEPLYVVDGIPIPQGNLGRDSTSNPLASFDPSNIESIQILKDASSTAIYGSRGANGVVLITTKRGERGQNRIEVQSSVGTQRVSNTIDVMNAQQFMTLANEANVNAGLAPRYTDAQIATAQTYNYPDLMLRNAQQQDHMLTLSGGDTDSRYLVSGSFANQQGIIVNSEFERFGSRVNFDQTVSKRFRTGVSLSGTRTEQKINSSENTTNNGIRGALEFDPSLAPRDAAGNWVKIMFTSDQTNNPLADASEIQNPRRISNLLGNVYGEYDLAADLKLRSTVGGNFGFEFSPYFAPRTIAPGLTAGVARRYSAQTTALTNENTLSYQRQLGPGTLDLVAGGSVQTSHFDEEQAEAQAFPSDELGANNLGAGATLRPASSNVVNSTLLSYLGRANYVLADRYVFTLTGRRDGSSRFGTNNKWAVFPSAAFAWRASEERFLRDRSYLSDLKLRTSYGRTGNQAVAEYQSLARLGTNFITLGNSEVVTLAPTTAAPNPDLKWETQDQFNVGVDLGLWNNRLTVSADAYQSKTSDLLLNVNLPVYSGYSTQFQNVGSVRNRGVEFALNTLNYASTRFTWRTSLNLAANRNEVLDIGQQARVLVGSFIVRKGEPLSSIFGYQVNGLYQQGDTCPLTTTAECTPGEFRILDANGDKRIDDNDRVILGNADPKLFGGLSNSMEFGPLSVEAFLNFSSGNKVVNLTNQRLTLAKGVFNERAEVVNRWTPTNTNTTVPRANAARINRLYSTLVEDGSFLRLQSVTLGYRVPARLLRAAGNVQSARLFVTGQNLLTATSYSGFDPEVNRNGGDPRQRGVDLSSYPRARIWNAGVSASF